MSGDCDVIIGGRGAVRARPAAVFGRNQLAALSEDAVTIGGALLIAGAAT